eukprot:TRINITY_DN322_c1_g1_i2.p3 TRINITY_DN322_c1_g1~~TRINITY_DN322_c1_g1_i2.p3  ORF type:complete len:225 (+),score=70.05 TRINITY_DN322_c1_g1_i2:1334-2008(+)
MDSTSRTLHAFDPSIDAIYAGYVDGILSDQDADDEEKRESLQETLSAVTEKPLEDFIDKLIITWKENRKVAEDKQRAASASQLATSLASLSVVDERQDKEVDTTSLSPSSSSSSSSSLTREEKKQRDALLSRYSYEEHGTDENGDIVLKDTEQLQQQGKKKEGPSLGSGNDNKQKVADADAAAREKAKHEHAKKVQHEKELLEKDKQRKEKEKKRTEKKEKRRL